TPSSARGSPTVPASPGARAAPHARWRRRNIFSSVSATPARPGHPAVDQVHHYRKWAERLALIATALAALRPAATVPCRRAAWIAGNTRAALSLKMETYVF